jgi:hypothetical protein
MLATIRTADQVSLDAPAIETPQFLADQQGQAITHPFTT